MKFPKEMNEKMTEFKKIIVKPTSNNETSALTEGKEASVSNGKCDDKEISGCMIEPNAAALIPPWIRSSLGLNDKCKSTTRPYSQKGFKTFPGSSDRSFAEPGEIKTDPDDDYVKNNFYVQDTTSAVVVKVNIGHEADFIEDTSGKTQWKSRGSKHDQYDCNIFNGCKDKRSIRSVKSDVTSIDVVIPEGDNFTTPTSPEEERRKIRGHRLRTKTLKRSYVSEPKTDIPKIEGKEMVECKDEPMLLHGSPSKQLDARLLLLCGKNKIDNLTDEDFSLLQEMKNQIGHKEGFEKLFNGIKQSSPPAPIFKQSIPTKPKREESPFRKETPRTSKTESEINAKTKTEEPETKAYIQIVGKTRNEEERKFVEEPRKHHERKKLSHHRHVKTADEMKISKQECESEMEKRGPEKQKGMQKILRDKYAGDCEHSMIRIKEKRSKSRICDIPGVERAVSDTLQKFIEMYRLHIPVDVLNSMKKNIVQTIQTEYLETGIVKTSADDSKDLITDSDKMLMEKKTRSKEMIAVGGSLKKFGEEKEKNSTEESLRSLLDNAMENNLKENDVVENENLKDLRKEFDVFLNSIQNELNITGTKLCWIALEKSEAEEDKSSRRRIFHNFANGKTESVKIQNENCPFGNLDGDDIRTELQGCSNQDNNSQSVAMVSQSCQTKGKKVVKKSTQTDWLDLSLGDLKNMDLPPGLYRIMNPSEMARFYLCPEMFEEMRDFNSRTTLGKRAGEEWYDNSENDVFIGYGRCRDDLMKSISKETSVSGRGILLREKFNRRVHRTIKSDCIGLNTMNSDELRRKESKNSLINMFIGAHPTMKQVCVIQERDAIDAESAEKLNEFHDDEEKGNLVSSESYHVGCVWFWNGKKMDPGVDLKVHVEDLLREKLKEILSEAKIEEAKNSGSDKPEELPEGDPLVLLPEKESSERNLEIRKTDAKFCIPKEHDESEEAPFVFSATNEDGGKEFEQVRSDHTNSVVQEVGEGKSVREVGTQNSEHSFFPLVKSKIKPKSKFCAVSKTSKQRLKRHSAHRNRDRGRMRIARSCAYSEGVGVAKKVKLEFNNGSLKNANSDSGVTYPSENELFSRESMESSLDSSGEGPVRVKLIGIEVSKKKKGFGDLDGETYKLLKDSNEEYGLEERESEAGDHIPAVRMHKHWQLVENVLNRVSQEEKDSLWDDIRDFVKKKIGRDINDEGAREVCIEIEQDVPKGSKGKFGNAVVARGNYTRNQGDVEVVVDLTLDDLERILRHRQRKVRRQHYQSQHMKAEQKRSSTSTGSSERTFEYEDHMNDFGINYGLNRHTAKHWRLRNRDK